MDELLTLIRQNLKQPGNEVSKRKQEEYVATNREQLLEETKNSVETYREQAQLHMEQHLPQGHFKKLKVWLKGAASYVSLARKRPDIAKEILATAAGFVLTATGAATTNIDTTLIGLTVAGFGMYASVKANEKRELPVEGNIGEDFGAPTGKEGKRVGDYYKALNVNIKRREKEAKAHPTHEH
jgi:hypothetical protein